MDGTHPRLAVFETSQVTDNGLELLLSAARYVGATALASRPASEQWYQEQLFQSCVTMDGDTYRRHATDAGVSSNWASRSWKATLTAQTWQVHAQQGVSPNSPSVPPAEVDLELALRLMRRIEAGETFAPVDFGKTTWNLLASLINEKLSTRKNLILEWDPVIHTRLCRSTYKAERRKTAVAMLEARYIAAENV